MGPLGLLRETFTLLLPYSNLFVQVRPLRNYPNPTKSMLQVLYDALNVAQRSQSSATICTRVSEILLILALEFFFKKSVIKSTYSLLSGLKY